MAYNCPQNQKNQPVLPPAVPLQQLPAPGNRQQLGHGGAFHYQGGVVSNQGRPYQYTPEVPYYQGGYQQTQGGYPQFQGDYTPYQGGGAQMYTGGQYHNLDVASSSEGSGRQAIPPQQG
ncbi:hypothetical protein ACFX2G_038816 [Malus domestica]